MPPVTSAIPSTETLFPRLAREIAMELHDVETILKTYQVSDQIWASIQRNPRFNAILESEITAWNSAVNTHERAKLKAAALIEFWLEEANERLHDRGENLPAKVELGKLIARIAGMGLTGTDVNAGGEKFSVTINLGADAKLTFQKETMKTIEGEVVRE